MEICLKRYQFPFSRYICLTFNFVSRGKLQMVLLPCLLRVTTVNIELSVFFHVVNLWFRLNIMMVNTNCKEISVQFLFQITTCDEVKCVIFCEEPGTPVCSDTCQLSFYKTNTKDLQSYFFRCIAESILCLFHFI